jgi:cell wall-associated NlpC family hydrolase
MTEPTEPTPADPARHPGRRKLIVTLAAVVVVAGALVTAIQLAPDSPPKPVAATTPAPPPSETPAAGTTEPAKVPANTGQEFDDFARTMGQRLDIPERAMIGYAKATNKLTKDQPACHLSWVTLAAIGKTTTDHGRAAGATFADSGGSSKAIGEVELRDFYGNNVSTLNAGGPMQLSAALWAKWQQSASGGKPDPQNIDDAALTTGRALCAEGRDLSNGDAWWTAVSTLQPAPLYLHRTLATLNVYGTAGNAKTPPKPAVLAAVNFAISKIGLPYVWGGNGTGGSDPGFDCSGLTTAAYASAGITLSRTADSQFRSVPHVTEPALGDLIFYGVPATKIHHVGLYIGNQQMIDAPTEGQAVQVHTYRKPGDDFAGAGDPVA